MADQTGATEPLRSQFDSYEPRARTPVVGSTWIWERAKPHATEQIIVTSVSWNGEEWWVRSRGLDSDEERWNDVGRFWEAVWPDPDPNELEVGGELMWSGRPSFAKDLPSGWVNAKAGAYRWSLISENRWRRVELKAD
jgi:hypothetical protein